MGDLVDETGDVTLALQAIGDRDLSDGDSITGCAVTTEWTRPYRLGLIASLQP
jgi:hypothetical protein